MLRVRNDYDRFTSRIYEVAMAAEEIHLACELEATTAYCACYSLRFRFLLSFGVFAFLGLTVRVTGWATLHLPSSLSLL